MAKNRNNDGFINNSFLVILIVVLTMVSVAMGVFWFYVKHFEDKFTVTTGYMNESPYFQDYDGGRLLFGEFNIYTNEEETVNGVSLYEMQLTRYTDKNHETFEKLGIQAVGNVYNNNVTRSWLGWWKSITETGYIGDIEGTGWSNRFKDDVQGNNFYKNKNNSLFYYNNSEATKGDSYVSSSSSSITNNTHFYFNIGTKVYKLALRGRYLAKEGEAALGWREEYFIDVTPEYMFVDMYKTIKSAPVGTSYIPWDLGEYFYIYDENDEPIKSDAQDLFAWIKINKYTDGAVRATQSMFGLIAEDPKYNSLGETEEEFYDVYTLYNLNESHFDKRSSVTEEGKYLLTLKTSVVEEIKKYKNLFVQVNLNLNDSNIIGFDYYCFDNVKVNNIKLTSSTEKDFKFMTSYCSSTASVDKITYTKNINLIFNSENKSELVEVAV